MLCYNQLTPLPMPLSDLSQDICIMARTDARATLGLDEAIDRWDLTFTMGDIMGKYNWNKFNGSTCVCMYIYI